VTAWKYFGITPAFWVGMQARYDLEGAADEVAAEIQARQGSVAGLPILRVHK
jgi:plasmid maintenance system antidote protein VapI